MSCFHWLVLTAVKKINGERKLGGIYHLLTGKHSAQTIQDAYLFQLSPIVSSLNTIDKIEYEQLINYFYVQKIIHLTGEYPTMTAKGEQYYEQLSEKFYLPPYYHGGKFEWNKATSKLWNRLSLTIQTVSHIVSQTINFIPVCYELETQRWVKLFLRNNNYRYKLICEMLYNELIQFLSIFSERERELFVNRLTGYGFTGKTFDQLCLPYEEDPLFAKMYFRSILHKMIAYVNKQPIVYPLLSQFLDGISEQKMITATAQQTWYYVKQGKSMEEIARIRGLKTSTIEDHFIELAIYEEDFSLDPYLSKEQLDQILTVVKKLNSKRLRHIKEHLPAHITYFQIRLALTQLNRGHGVG